MVVVESKYCLWQGCCDVVEWRQHSMTCPTPSSARCLGPAWTVGGSLSPHAKWLTRPAPRRCSRTPAAIRWSVLPKKINFDDAAAFWITFYHLIFKANGRSVKHRDVEFYVKELAALSENPSTTSEPANQTRAASTGFPRRRSCELVGLSSAMQGLPSTASPQDHKTIRLTASSAGFRRRYMPGGLLRAPPSRGQG